MKTKKPNYTTRKVADGTRLELTLLDKGADGLIHSASCEYPLFLLVDVEKTKVMADGKELKLVEKEWVKQTKKQTENYLLKMLGC